MQLSPDFIVIGAGMTGGFAMFVKDGRIYYDYNYLNGVYYTLESPKLRKGTTEVKFNFIKTEEFAGTGELYVNDEKVAESDMPKMHISTYSLAETFDVGMDTSSPVANDYFEKPPFASARDYVRTYADPSTALGRAAWGTRRRHIAATSILFGMTLGFYMMNSASFEGFATTATSTRSNRPAQRSITSRCPFVGGSKLPGTNAAITDAPSRSATKRRRRIFFARPA